MQLQQSNEIDIWEYRDVFSIDHRFSEPKRPQARPNVNLLIWMIYEQ